MFVKFANSNVNAAMKAKNKLDNRFNKLENFQGELSISDLSAKKHLKAK